MSSHYIYVSCTENTCETFETIYTGDVYLDNFSDSAFEGETIYVPCKIHEATQ